MSHFVVLLRTEATSHICCAKKINLLLFCLASFFKDRNTCIEILSPVKPYIKVNIVKKFILKIHIQSLTLTQAFSTGKTKQNKTEVKKEP